MQHLQLPATPWDTPARCLHPELLAADRRLPQPHRPLQWPPLAPTLALQRQGTAALSIGHCRTIRVTKLVLIPAPSRLRSAHRRRRLLQGALFEKRLLVTRQNTGSGLFGSENLRLELKILCPPIINLSTHSSAHHRYLSVHTAI